MTKHKYDLEGLCLACGTEKGQKHSCGTKHTPTPLDKVCIMQKYNDSNAVLECREEFRKAEQFIVKAVNCHDELVEALSRLIERLATEGKIDHITDEGMIEDAFQALKKAGA